MPQSKGRTIRFVARKQRRFSRSCIHRPYKRFIFRLAFVSFGIQAKGLIGSGGLLPAGDFLKAAREAFGPSAFLRVPTLLWLDSSDRMIAAVSIAGAIFAVAAFLVPRLSLAACL